MIVSQMYGLGDVANDTWPSTGEIDTETESLWNSMLQLSRDWFDGGAPGWTPALQNAWNTFVNDVKQWRDSSYFWNPGRREELLSYRKRFNDFVTRFQGAGVDTLVTPGQAGSDTKGPDALDKLGDVATKLMWAAGIVGALWAGHTIYKEFR